MLPADDSTAADLGWRHGRKPLRRFGIRWTDQGGFNANQDQEIHWQWDAEEVKRRVKRLDSVTKVAMVHGQDL